ncbi:hypothetical protein [Arcticibacter sp. MXS-1]|uniref:hypothetical protein n=1 Tax=Arcticibacter sp. MXS-1 TaxID=3341726 RepID=UPI0035A8A30B
MQEPFDIEMGEITYSVFPEEEGTYTIFKEGKEYMKIQKDDEGQWLKLDDETELPLFNENEEVSVLGKAIQEYTA